MKCDGGPAFPGEQGHTPEGTWNQTFDPGMSLRDWFAGQAMREFGRAPYWDGKHQDELARICYSIADAMLAERGKAAT